MTIHDEKVIPTVVVVVDEADAPAEERDGDVGDTNAITNVSKRGVAVVAIENLEIVGEICEGHVRTPVIEVASDAEAHAGDFASILVEGEARGIAIVGERTVAAIAIKVIRSGVVANQQIGSAVIVHIGKNRGESIVFVLFIGDAGFHADVGECAVAVVMEEVVGLALKAARAACESIDAAKAAVGVSNNFTFGIGKPVQIEVHVPADEKVEQPVTIVVSPRGACGPVAKRDTRFFGHVGKRPIAIIVIESVLSIVGHKDVDSITIIAMGRFPTWPKKRVSR